MVLKKGSLMTSGQTAGHGLPHIRLQQVKQNETICKSLNYYLSKLLAISATFPCCCILALIFFKF